MGAWPLTIVSILYFHTMYVAFAGTILGILIHFYINRKSTTPENYKRVAQAAIVTTLFTIPWFWFNFPVFAKITEFYLSTSNQIDTTSWRFLKNLIGFLFQLNNYIFPFILLPLLFIRSLRSYKSEIQLCLCCSHRNHFRFSATFYSFTTVYRWKLPPLVYPTGVDYCRRDYLTNR